MLLAGILRAFWIFQPTLTLCGRYKSGVQYVPSKTFIYAADSIFLSGMRFAGWYMPFFVVVNIVPRADA